MAVHEIEIAREADEVWRAIVDPDLTRRYYFQQRFDARLVPGAAYAYRTSETAEATEEGTIVEAVPERLLRLRGRYRLDPRAAAEPEHEVTWRLQPRGSSTHVSVTCDAAPDTFAAGLQAKGMPAILAGLRDLLVPGAVPARLERVGEITVRELVPALRDDYLRFFDEEAFRDNPAWSFCYCTHWHHATSEEAGLKTSAENRALAAELARGGRRGLLAYADGKVVGWCNAAPRASLLRMPSETALAVPDAERVGSIACFVIAVAYRRHGVARRLLDAALHRFAREGFAFAEAYPARSASSDATAWKGPLQLYLDAGFTPYRELERSLIVRKPLA